MKEGEPIIKGKEALADAYADSYSNEPLNRWEALHDGYYQGYEDAEKDTIDRAIAWLKEHANEYIVDLTPTYPDAPVNIIVGGMCWEHLKDYLEEEK